MAVIEENEPTSASTSLFKKRVPLWVTALSTVVGAGVAITISVTVVNPTNGCVVIIQEQVAGDIVCFRAEAEAPEVSDAEVEEPSALADNPKPDRSELEQDLLVEDPPTTEPKSPPTTQSPDPMQLPPNDVPVLFDLDNGDVGGEYSWYKPPAEIDSTGYGDNGFWFTLAIGTSGDDELDNFARWEFDRVDGLYDIQAWIPSAWASAEVQYLIWVDENDDGEFSQQENLHSPWLDQSEFSTEVSGWASLGRFPLKGRVRIEVHDTRSSDDWRANGGDIASIVASRIAVDAIRLVEVAGQ